MHDDNVRYVVSPYGLQPRTADHTCVTHADETICARIAAHDFAQVEVCTTCTPPV